MDTVIEQKWDWTVSDTVIEQWNQYAAGDRPSLPSLPPGILQGQNRTVQGS
jgi:hypothetical protein